MAKAKKKSATARKIKTTKSKAPKVAKAPKVNEKRIPVETPDFNTDARDGEKSGVYIRRLLPPLSP